jgi:two-component system sensor histidine kinase DesK
MVKEIFNNIVKHANATEVSCTFSVDHEFEIRIHDNGKGFVKQEASGNGLKNIEERIKFLSGTWELDPQNGVSIHLQIPFQNLKNDLDT